MIPAAESRNENICHTQAIIQECGTLKETAALTNIKQHCKKLKTEKLARRPNTICQPTGGTGGSEEFLYKLRF